jgi:hypothetical protein
MDPEVYMEFDASTGQHKLAASDAWETIPMTQLNEPTIWTEPQTDEPMPLPMPAHYPPAVPHDFNKQAGETIPSPQIADPEVGKLWTDNAASVYWKGQSMQGVVAMLHLARLAGLQYGFYGLIENGQEISNSLVAIRTPAGIMQFLVEPNWLAAIQEQAPMELLGMVGYDPTNLDYHTTTVIHALKFAPVGAEVKPHTQIHNQLHPHIKSQLNNAATCLKEALTPKVHFAPTRTFADMQAEAYAQTQHWLTEGLSLLQDVALEC